MHNLAPPARLDVGTSGVRAAAVVSRDRVAFASLNDPVPLKIEAG